MRHLVLALTAVAAIATLASFVPARSQNRSATAETIPRSGVQDFDFEFGDWSVHHRVKRAADGQWLEFDGACTTRSLMDGAMNVEEHIFNKPDGTTRGVALRAYDEKTRQWAIWWVDSRAPLGALDPPMMGRFENGVGTFYSDGILKGKATRTRFIWSQITPASARWEQAYSADSGKTWETNWIMEFRRSTARKTVAGLPEPGSKNPVSASAGTQ